MRRQAQHPGIKKWSGNDLLDLQHECLKIADSFLGQFGQGILSGCRVDGTTITPGLIYLDGKVIPFAGAQDIALFPVYLKVKHQEIMREYVDNLVKPIADDYTAELVTQVPEDVPYLIIERQDNPTFFELLQNDSRLFMTKTERDKLRDIEAQANRIIVDTAISATSTNPVQNKVIKSALDGKADASHTHNYAGSASAGGAANSVKTNLVVKLNGGTTEGTNQFTYNGSAAKSVNVTPGNIGAVPTSRKINGKALTADITLSAADVSAVPTTRKVNGKALSADITLTAEDVGAVSGNHTHNYAGSASAGGAANSVKANLVVKLNSGTTEGTNQFTYNGSAAKSLNVTPANIGAVPTTRKVNGKALSADITLSAADVGAALAAHTHNYAGSASAGGAANTAVKLATPRAINGTNFDGSAAISFGTLYPASIPANANLNNYTQPGMYYCPANATAATIVNRPTANAFSLLVEKHAGIRQVVTEYMVSGCKTYCRNFYSSWGAWYRVYTTIDAPTSVSGNSGTATKLATPRAINGTNFDGSAAITTAKWGTTRTFALTGDITGAVSVDGGSNINLATVLAKKTLTDISGWTGEMLIYHTVNVSITKDLVLNRLYFFQFQGWLAFVVPDDFSRLFSTSRQSNSFDVRSITRVSNRVLQLVSPGEYTNLLLRIYEII